MQDHLTEKGFAALFKFFGASSVARIQGRHLFEDDRYLNIGCDKEIFSFN